MSIIGIDLGTTHSVVAVMDKSRPVVIKNSYGKYSTPSAVAFGKNGEVLVGQPALNQRITNPEATLFSIKRLLGKRYNISKELLPYKTTINHEGYVCVNINGNIYTAPQIISFILSKLKKDAESYLGKVVDEAVITVPSYYYESQRQATLLAGKLAGLKVKRIINESTAAALTFGHINNTKLNKKIAVVHFGGGTFDVSVLDVGDSVFEVLGTYGDTTLGGDDIDNLLIKHLLKSIDLQTQASILSDPVAIQRLKEAAEIAKCELSMQREVEVDLPYLHSDSSGSVHLKKTISRYEFENLICNIISNINAIIEKSFIFPHYNIYKSEIDDVMLIGGSTRIPLVHNTINKYFGRTCRHSNSDDTVAIGAALQGGILSGDSSIKDLLILDIIPMSVGLETKGGVIANMIERNTTIPTEKKEIFSTVEDNQSVIEVRVFQGESEIAEDNHFIGNLILDNIPPMPKGKPQIEVVFRFDTDGILSVTAKDLDTGKEKQVRMDTEAGYVKKNVVRKSQGDSNTLKQEKENKSRDNSKQDVRNGNKAGTPISKSDIKQTKKQFSKLIKTQIKKVKKDKSVPNEFLKNTKMLINNNLDDIAAKMLNSFQYHKIENYAFKDYENGIYLVVSYLPWEETEAIEKLRDISIDKSIGYTNMMNKIFYNNWPSPDLFYFAHVILCSSGRMHNAWGHYGGFPDAKHEFAVFPVELLNPKEKVKVV